MLVQKGFLINHSLYIFYIERQLKFRPFTAINEKQISNGPVEVYDGLLIYSVKGIMLFAMTWFYILIKIPFKRL